MSDTATPVQAMPALFISHGTPMLALAAADQDEHPDEFVKKVRNYLATLPKPKAIVILSAHGPSDSVIEVSAGTQGMAFHDFSGFPAELYQMNYPCPGAPELSARVAGLLADSGFQAALTQLNAFDHGVWVPLMVAYPKADIPVVRIGMPDLSEENAALTILKLGKALAPLRNEGVLLVGSGGAVHNLSRLVWHGKHSTPPEWALAFENWVETNLVAKDVQTLLDFREEGPETELAHPTPEHFYPIFFILGAALPGDEAEPIYDGIQYGALSMLTFALGSPPTSVH